MKSKTIFCILFVLAAVARGQVVNPGTLSVTTTPWSLDWLLNTDAADGFVDLGIDSYWAGPCAEPNAADVFAYWHVGVFNVRHYGATGDGTTDDTAAIQLAIDKAEAAGGGVVYFPTGTYRCNVTMDSIDIIPSLRGAGTRVSILRSYTAGSPVIHITGVGDVTHPVKWSDIRIWGYADAQRDSNGVDVDGAFDWLNLHCEDVAFYYCNNGFATRGLLKYSFENCTFRGNNIGLYIDNYPTNHGGCAILLNCNVESNINAGICAEGGSQLHFIGGEYEENYGPAIFMKDAGSWVYPTIIAGIWFEDNGKGDTVTLAGDTFDPDDKSLWLENAKYVQVSDTTNSAFYSGGATFVRHVGGRDSIPWQDACADANNVFVSRDVWLDNTNTSHSWVMNAYMPGAFTVTDDDANNLKIGYYTHPSTEVAYDYENLIRYGSCAVPFTPDDPNGKSTAFAAYDAPIYNYALYLDDIPADGDYLDGIIDLWPGNISVTEDKWYVFTVDAKSYGENGYLSIQDNTGLVYLRPNGTAPATYGYGMYVTTDRWRRFVTVRQAPDSKTITGWRVYNGHPTIDPNYILANAQLVEFDSAQQAYEFVQRNAFCPDSSIPRLYHDDDPNDAATVTVMTADNGKWFSNAGAAAPCEFDLPLATPGQEYGFIRAASYAVTIDPSGTEKFRPDGAGDYLQLDTDGDTVRIKCFESGVWDIIAGYGSYTFE